MSSRMAVGLAAAFLAQLLQRLLRVGGYTTIVAGAVQSGMKS